MIGKVLGNRYRILREVGTGGMAQVYLAEDGNDKRLVAVKVLYPQFGEDLSYVQRFKREAKLASALTSPHIVRVLDYGADRDVYYLIMEYIAGQDLRDKLDEIGQFTWRDALETLDQLASALEHASEFGIVHRDVKPQNLMIEDGGLLKVLDFGIARVDALPSLTQSGFVGSPYYVSPEQAMGEPVDVRSDIYSAGVVLYEMLSGDIPFDAKSPWSVISKHISSEPPPINFSEDDVPQDVQNLMARMIAKRPEGRFQTPLGLRHAISAILSGHSIPEGGLNLNDSDTEQLKLNIADNFYQRGVKAINMEEWGRASGLFQEALKLNPDHQGAIDKIDETERQAVLLADYNGAKQAIKNGFWQDAVNRLENVVKQQSDYRDAQELLDKAQENVQRDAVRKPVAVLYDDALALIEKRDWKQAIDQLEEIQRISPGYQDINELLVQSKAANKRAMNDPSLQTASTSNDSDRSLWLGAIGIGIILVLVAGFIYFNYQLSSQGTEDVLAEAALKSLYQEAQEALEVGNDQQALTLLEEIASENPDYANVASLIRELKATPTATPESTVTPVPTVDESDPLAEFLDEAQDALDLGRWSDVVDKLQELQAKNSDYETARVSSMLCDAYVNRGLDILANLDPDAGNPMDDIETALQDFETGADECPIRTDLREQANRASAYLELFSTPEDDYDMVIQTLTPIVSAQPDYAAGQAKMQLYNSHLNRGDSWREQNEMVRALTDYEAALALNVPDPIEARTRQAELLVGGLEEPTPEPTETPLSIATPIESQDTTAEEGTSVIDDTPTPPALTPQPMLEQRDVPILLTENDGFFVGPLTDVIVEWEPVPGMAEDEYYDLTVTHIYGDQIVYWGQATKETSFKLSPDIGLGEAGNDRFNWWITVRKENTAKGNNLDQAISDRSEIRTFIWEAP
ncbi:protein kinase [Anaerolineales bacterium HSG24]|nr:protein kinase [Anaerolineales bacterium HSG24]